MIDFLGRNGWGLAVIVSLGVASIAAGPTNQEKPTDPQTSLLDEVTAYRTALDRAAKFSTSSGDLGVNVMIYRDAFEYEVVDRLALELAKEKPLPLVLDALQERRKELDRLKDHAGIRLELTHPRHEPQLKPGKPQTVHIFPAALDKSAPVIIGKKRQRWAAWRPLAGMKPTRVQVARHYKFIKRREVPIMSELTPKTKRFVFAGARQSIWGLLSPAALRGKSRQLRVTLPEIDMYRGPFDGRQVVDLNADGHSWQRKLAISVDGTVPSGWPEPPNRVREILDRFRAKPDDSSPK